MRNRMVLIVGAIVVLFAALYFLNDYKNKQALDNSENPYGKNELRQETIDQLDDPLYQNQITPAALKENIESGDEMTVYFYSPTCVHCQNTTPVLVPVTEQLNIDMKKLNLLEFEDQWEPFGIEGTPTLVHYNNGEEVSRISGEHTEEEFKDFFEQYVLK